MAWGTVDEALKKKKRKWNSGAIYRSQQERSQASIFDAIQGENNVEGRCARHRIDAGLRYEPNGQGKKSTNLRVNGNL